MNPTNSRVNRKKFFAGRLSVTDRRAMQFAGTLEDWNEPSDFDTLSSEEPFGFNRSHISKNKFNPTDPGVRIRHDPQEELKRREENFYETYKGAATFRRSDPIPTVFSLGFNHFRHEVSALPDLVLSVVSELRLRMDTNEEPLHNLVAAIIEGYPNNPFHNAYHGFAVFHVASIFLTMYPILGRTLKQNHSLAFLLAALAHDIGHPGYSSGLERAANSPLATLCDNKSILENLHASELLNLMDRKECDVFGHTGPRQRLALIHFMVKLIMSTDPSLNNHHHANLKKIKSLPEYFRPGDELHEGEKKMKLFNALIHVCDLSAQCSDLEVAVRWERRLAVEFMHEAMFREDTAQEIPPHMALFMHNTEEQSMEDLFGIKPMEGEEKFYRQIPSEEEAKNQHGFLKTQVKPLWNAVTRICPMMKEFEFRATNSIKFFDKLAKGDKPAAQKLFKKSSNKNVLITKIYERSILEEKVTRRGSM